MGIPWRRLGLGALGVLLIAAVVVHYVFLSQGWWASSWRRDVAARVADWVCVCSLVNVALAVAFLRDDRRLGTWAVVAWLVFPATSTFQRYVLHHSGIPWGDVGSLLMLIAVPVALVAGYRVLREIPLGFGIAFLAFAPKGIVNWITGAREMPIWVPKSVGFQWMQAWFVPLNAVIVSLGVILVLVGLRVRRPRPPKGPPR